MITGRELQREEIAQVWEIDRSEVIGQVYYHEDGELVLKPEHFEMSGWPPGAAEGGMPILLDCFDRGGWAYGLFDDNRLIGVALLESRFIGVNKDQLQLVFLHVSRAYRDPGIGKQLFGLARTKARERGAKRMYISATPSEHTIRFYLGIGCVVTTEPDAELFALEPEDIHFECKV